MQAIEPGRVTAVYLFTGDTSAVIVANNTGTSTLYGEVDPLVKVGKRVKAGTTLGTIALLPHGSSMLHLELYAGRVDRNKQWPSGSPQPAGLLNPDAYVARASQRRKKKGGSGVLLALATIAAVLLV